MKTLVIGATGIIGNHIVRALLKEGHEVIGLSRGVMPSVNLDGLSVTRLKADLLDVKALKEAFKGVDWVFQAAGYYPRDAFHNKQHVAQALAGVRSVIAAALDAGIERLVYTSSLTTIGQASEGGLADESLSYDLLG
ncbi:MAG TPA: NAD-dependent epimerase/dehydratase family protein, partial [bacterium]|nr:NAD-dependent epimerase/dehydratase family protein [bacterium]